MKKLYLLAMVLVMAVVMVLAPLGGTPGLASDGEDSNHKYAFYTERYWQAAAERESGLKTTGTGNETGDAFSFYTERYWQAAASRNGELETATENGGDSGDSYAFYTERYWQAAAARDKATAAYR